MMTASPRSLTRPSPVLAFACALVLSAGVACTKDPTSKLPPTLGKRLSEAPARALKATADGAHLVFVSDVEPPIAKDVPEGMMVGALVTVPSTGGPVRVLGQGVTTLSDAFQLSPDSRFVAFLTKLDVARHVGALRLADLSRPEEAIRALGEAVSFYDFSADRRFLGYVDAGSLRLLNLATGKETLVESGVATFEFASDGQALLVRKPLAAGGQLRLVTLGDDGVSEARTLAERVGDYGFSADGRFVALTARVDGPNAPYRMLAFDRRDPSLQPRSLGDEAGAFVFSPDSKLVAFVANQTPGMPYGDLFVTELASGEQKRVGQSVADFRFSPTSDAIALRENQRNERGQMWQEFKVVRLPSGAVRLHQKSLPKAFINFLFSDDGRELAFIKHVHIDINLWRLDMDSEAPPELVAPWAFEYRFAKPREGAPRALWYRGACIREGRQCDLFEALKREAPPEDVQAKVDESGTKAVADKTAVDSVASAGTGAVAAAGASAGAGAGADAGTGAAKTGRKPAEPKVEPPKHPKIAFALSNFTIAPSGERLFLDLPRLDSTDAFDLAWQPVAKSAAAQTGVAAQTIDRQVLKNSLVLLDEAGSRIAYIVMEKRRAGVHVADIP